jgi:hypothetical protein
VKAGTKFPYTSGFVLDADGASRSRFRVTKKVGLLIVRKRGAAASRPPPPKRTIDVVNSSIVAATYLYDHHPVNRMSCVRSILGCRSFYRKSTMMLGYPLSRKSQFSLCFNSGRPTQKESHLIQKSMERFRSNYITNIIDTYEEIKESFHYLTHQTGDPDMVRF